MVGSVGGGEVLRVRVQYSPHCSRLLVGSFGLLFPCAVWGWNPRAVLKGGKKTFVTPTETNFHWDAFCFMVMAPSLLQRLAVGCWWLVVGGG